MRGHIHVQCGSWETAAEVPLAPAWKKSAESHLLPQLFLMIPADLALLSGNYFQLAFLLKQFYGLLSPKLVFF